VLRSSFATASRRSRVGIVHYKTAEEVDRLLEALLRL
jgi:selenocysteine lyase/cysteine desulfurase